MNTSKLERFSWIAGIIGAGIAVFSWLSDKGEPNNRPPVTQTQTGTGANISVGGNSTAPITVSITGAQAKDEISEMISHFQAFNLTVLDTKSGLTWMRCALGQNWNGMTCTGRAADYRWYQAMEVPRTFQYAGHKDWRVPTIQEAKSLVFCSRGERNDYKTHADGDVDCQWDHTRKLYSKLFSESFEQVVWTASSAYEPKRYQTVAFGMPYDNPANMDHDFKLRLVRGKIRER